MPKRRSKISSRNFIDITVSEMQASIVKTPRRTSYKLDPFKAPSTEDFVNLFQSDIVNFLSKKIVKNFKQVDLSDLCHDFTSYFYSENMFAKYSPNYNYLRVQKVELELSEKELEFEILSKPIHQSSKDKKILDNLKNQIEKKKQKLEKCIKKANRPTKFKTYLFWCLRSYWWWHVVKTVDIFRDDDNVMREHIRTTPQPLVVSQISKDDDYKFGDISNAVYQSVEEENYRREVSQRAAKRYLEGFEKYLREQKEGTSIAFALLMDGLNIEEVSLAVGQNSDTLMHNLINQGKIFSQKIGNFSEYCEYC